MRLEHKMSGHPRFYALLSEIAELHAAKNHDYAGDADPLRNLRMCEAAGIEAWKGVVVRLTDKLARLQGFAKTEELKVADESVIDTFKDMAVYSLLGLILFEESLSPERFTKAKQSSDTSEYGYHLKHDRDYEHG